MNNIILIGMPGAGKSTVGVLVAKALGMDFIDTDLIIQRREGRTLQQIIDADGLGRFIAIEDGVVSSVDARDSVIATGGSVIFGENAMRNLARLGTIVYLRAGFDTVKARISNISTRGVAMNPGQDLRSVYDERCPLYEKHAHVTVDVDGGSVETSVAAMISALEKRADRASVGRFSLYPL